MTVLAHTISPRMSAASRLQVAVDPLVQVEDEDILQSRRYVEDAIPTLLVDHVGRQAHDAVQVALDDRL
eukprot:16402236-Heterocapsa_arctica.AAC.1